MYIPKGAMKAESISNPQVRLLIHGRPATGKTWAAAGPTTPGPVVLDLDGGCTTLKHHNPNAIVLPFYSADWLKANCNGLSTKDAVKVWLNTEARKLTREQTLVIDSLSAWQDCFHIELEKTPKITKQGGEDSFYIWGEKLKYFRDCHFVFATLTCNVIVIAHEREIRDDKTGVLLSKVLPSMTGSFADSLGRYYTDVFHQFTTGGENGKPIEYWWQVRGDSRYDLKTRMTNCPDKIKAEWASLKY